MLWAEGHVKRLATHTCHSDPTFSAGSKSLVRKLAQGFVPAEIVRKPSQTSYSTRRCVRQNATSQARRRSPALLTAFSLPPRLSSNPPTAGLDGSAMIIRTTRRDQRTWDRSHAAEARQQRGRPG